MSIKTVKKTSVKKLKPYRSVKALNHVDFDTDALIKICIKGALNSKDYNKRAEYNIVITSCENKILLHGGLTTPQKRMNAIFKLDSLISELSKAKEYLELELKDKRVTISKP